MNRRQFLQFMTAGAVALAVPLAVPEALILGRETPKSLIANFDPSKEYGIAMSYVSSDQFGEQAYCMLQDTLIADARRQLPEGTRFELRKMIPTDYGRHCGMAWYTHPNRMRTEPLRNWDTPWLATFDEAAACYIPESGVYIIGRQTV